MILKLLLVHLAMHLLFPGFWWIPKPRLVRIIIPHFSQRKYVKSTSWKFPVFLQFLAWWVRPGLVPVNIILILQIFFSFILISPCPIHPHFWQKCGSTSSLPFLVLYSFEIISAFGIFWRPQVLYIFEVLSANVTQLEGYQVLWQV